MKNKIKIFYLIFLSILCVAIITTFCCGIVVIFENRELGSVLLILSFGALVGTSFKCLFDRVLEEK